MGLRVIKNAQAIRDLIEAADYIAQDNFDAAEGLIDAVESAVELLAENPKVGSNQTLVNPRLTEIQMWPVRGFENYQIFYQATDTTLNIIRILHRGRNIAALFED